MKVLVQSRTGEMHALQCDPGMGLMKVLAESDLVEATCGGECSCATCQVYVDPLWLPKLPAQSALEREVLDALVMANEHSRLACQIVLTNELDGIKLEVARAE